MALTEEQGERLWLSRWEGWKTRAADKHTGKYRYPSPQRDEGGLITIECPAHGVFKQRAAKHMHGQGCAKCTGRGSDKVAELCKRYPTWDWSMVQVTHSKKPLELVCPDHGAFQTTFNRLMTKGGDDYPCPSCSRRAGGARRRVDAGVWKHRVEQRWGDQVTLDEASVQGSQDKARFTCVRHGEFLSVLADVSNGHGCPECGKHRFERWLDDNVRVGARGFVERAREIKTGAYEYDASTYVDQCTPMRMLCPQHGEFWQIPRNHVTLGAGCPACANGVSKGEAELADWLRTIGAGPVTRKRILDGWEVDIHLPDIAVGIEYCGLYWHGEGFKDRMYHADKLRRARAAGLRLVTVFEDEWQDQKDKVKLRLQHLLGASTRVSARKCSVEAITWPQAKAFLEANHLQGAGKPAQHCYALVLQDQLKAVATWGSDRFSRGDALELYRFCSGPGDVVQGGLSRLVKKALRDLGPSSLVTYADLRWGDGEGYGKVGFTKVGETPPGYFWCKGRSRFNRHHFQKHKLSSLLKTFDPLKTEVENCHANGYWRIYDCGHSKWTLEGLN